MIMIMITLYCCTLTRASTGTFEGVHQASFTCLAQVSRKISALCLLLYRCATVYHKSHKIPSRRPAEQCPCHYQCLHRFMQGHNLWIFGYFKAKVSPTELTGSVELLRYVHHGHKQSIQRRMPGMAEGRVPFAHRYAGQEWPAHG